MVGKKGYIKTLEAVLAIVLLLIFVYAVIPHKTPEVQTVPPIVKSAQDYIKIKIEQNDTIRELIVTTDPDNPASYQDVADMVNETIASFMPFGYDYEFNICDVTSCVVSTPKAKTIYVDDILISAQGGKQNPRLVRVWMWEK